ncbi:MAG: anti-sigma factor antagonist [Syntrophomonadaceae bacterium]|jgi:stage II sporulation protein AA (anti-sigma F factor antagonist)|nr:anti-sigma factor antagonist [Syntrophomonadaceae bacterium]
MNIDCKHIYDTLIIRLVGELDLLVSEKLRDFIDIKITENKSRVLILNLEKVSFVDSSGLGVIIGRYKKISAKKGKMYIAGAQPMVEQILVLSGINKLIPLCRNEQEIMENYREDGI